MSKVLVASAEGLASTFHISDGIYVLGCLEKGVTVYKQQTRAHNLIWALARLTPEAISQPTRIAVVGGGVTGMTAAACAISLFPSATITLFEKRWDLCPLQLGSDNRWLHPRIYDWPRRGSRAPTASLPIIDWSEGRASDVARQAISQFGAFARSAADRTRIYIGVNHLRITASTKTVEWIGTEAKLKHSFLHASTNIGTSETFDVIILAAGFGLEIQREPYVTTSYWRNEQIAQPVLNGTRQTYLISGYGDGALVDLCRLTLARFRQDSIVYELFGNRLEDVEELLRNLRQVHKDAGSNTMETLHKLPAGFLKDHCDVLRARIRNDTKVVMHLAGSNERNSCIADTFLHSASFLNHFLFYLLYRCGAFAANFEPLEDAVREYGVPSGNVLLRHGTHTMRHLLELFTDATAVSDALNRVDVNQAQTAGRYWEPGCFAPPNRSS